MLTDAGLHARRGSPASASKACRRWTRRGTRGGTRTATTCSIDNFDRDVYYYAKGVVGKGVKGYKDDEFYLNQHVFNGEYSYFGKLVTKRLTKIINLAAYKNTGHGSRWPPRTSATARSATPAACTRRSFFKVNTEVLAAPVVRDKLVLNITDGLRGQYDGGPDKNAQFVYPNHSLYFATDPFALDMVCHNELVAKRKAMGVNQREPALHRVPALRRVARPRRGGRGEDAGWWGVGDEYRRQATGHGHRAGATDGRGSRATAAARRTAAIALASWRARILAVTSPALAAAEVTPALLPPDGFTGWKKTAQPTRLHRGRPLRVHRRRRGAVPRVRLRAAHPAEVQPKAGAAFTVDLYRMRDPVAATGIYLMKCGKEARRRVRRTAHGEHVTSSCSCVTGSS